MAASGTRAALAAADEIHDEAFATTADVEVEAVLAEIADDVEMRLASADAAFVAPYRGAKHAIESRHADWNRHFAVSVRELLDHLIARLAPSNELGVWTRARPTAYFSQGEWTHRAQLHYIFRDVHTGPFVPMADKIIDVVLATFYPANSGVHELVAPHSERQARVLWRHMQHCLSTILEAAGY